MRKLSDKLYNKIEGGLEVKCPHSRCKGIVVKVTGEKFEQFSEVYWEKTNYYRCNRNCKHVWMYLRNAVDNTFNYLKKIKL